MLALVLALVTLSPLARAAVPYTSAEAAHWVCPIVGTDLGADGPAGSDDEPDSREGQHRIACSCDLPHTLRCTGGSDTLQVVGTRLAGLPPRYVSLLDVTVSGLSVLSALPSVALHGLVVSGELRAVEPDAFARLLQVGEPGEPRLQALGLPSNLLDAVPVAALATLSDLDRLDLSHNRLRSLPTDAFPGLHNLTFLDLSDNLLADISAGAFRSLASLETLRLTGNRLRVTPSSLSLLGGLQGLEGLRSLRELDLSSNQLAGPLGPGALPRLTNLRTLNLAHNQLSSVRRGALAGLPQLAALSLAHNMVDVLEDHAFRQLGLLASLDLAHNRIVAVSGASLAHLQRLRSLALQHNFLRALSADLLRPLSALQELHLDDNDISQVPTDAMDALELAASRLTRLTLAENPLNCDCALWPFARWMRLNATRLQTMDRASAVCAAPPHLENGLVEDVADVLCQDDLGQDADAVLRPGPSLALRTQAQDGKRVTLRALQFDGSTVSMLWAINVTAEPYVCDTLFVYEQGGPGGDHDRDHEELLETTPLGCDSSQLADPRSLLLALPVAARLAVDRRYRFCLVLLEGGGGHDDLALVKGCSDVLPLVKSSSPVVMAAGARASAPTPTARVSGLSANLTSTGGLAVYVQMSPSSVPSSTSSSCRLVVTVFVAGVLAAREALNCSRPATVIAGLGPGPLQACATTATAEPTATRCTSVAGQVGQGRRDTRSMSASASGAASAGLLAALTGAALLGGAGAALLLTLGLARRWRWRVGAGPAGGGNRLGLDQDTGRLYRPPPPPPNTNSTLDTSSCKLPRSCDR